MTSKLQGEIQFQPGSPLAPGASCITFQTAHTLCAADGFLPYWRQFGGLGTFGYPISEPFGGCDPQGWCGTMQWFQRALFEYHPGSDPARYNVELGLVGTEALATQPSDAVTPGAVTVGAAGNAVWAVTSSEFLSSTDQGAQWAKTPLPSGVVTGPGIAAAVSPAGALWLLSADGNTATFYQAASPGSSWTTTSISLTWPANAPGLALIPASERVATFGSSPSGIVTAVVTAGGAKTAPLSLVLLSTDGGKTFQQQNPPTVAGNWTTAFTSASDGVIVGDSNNSGVQAVYATTDGGATWHAATLPGYSASAMSALGTPLVSGSGIYLAANQPATSGGRQDVLYLSTDGGATFTAPETIAETTPDPDPPVIGVNGTTIWLVPHPDQGGTIETSTDGGATSQPVAAPSLKGGVISLGLANASDAAVWLGQSGCQAFKTNCSAPSAELLVTADSGQQWQQVAVPTQ